MYCVKCGKLAKENDNFCTGCGHKLEADSKTVEITLEEHERVILTIFGILMIIPIAISIPTLLNYLGDSMGEIVECLDVALTDTFYRIESLLESLFG